VALTDGAVGDDDDVANGMIADPSGLGNPATTEYTDGGHCFIIAAAGGSGHFPWTTRLRKAYHRWRHSVSFSGFYPKISNISSANHSLHPESPGMIKQRPIEIKQADDSQVGWATWPSW